jgi:hypothetical protein
VASSLLFVRHSEQIAIDSPASLVGPVMRGGSLRISPSCQAAQFLDVITGRLAQWLPFSTLRRTPMVGLFLIVEIADAGDKWVMAILFCPLDRLMLRFERGECVIRMILNHIIFNMAAFGPALRSRLNIDIRHYLISSL